MVMFGSEICKLHMCDFEVSQRMLQIAQIDKLRATVIIQTSELRRTLSAIRQEASPLVHDLWNRCCSH